MRVLSGGTAATSDERVFCARDAAEYLNTSIKWIYDHAESGFLPCRKLDRMIRFVGSELDCWLDSSRRGRENGAFHDGSRLMTVEDLGLYLHVSRSWVYEARRSKGLPYFKLDGLLRFSRPLIDAWLSADASAPTHGGLR